MAGLSCCDTSWIAPRDSNQAAPQHQHPCPTLAAHLQALVLVAKRPRSRQPAAQLLFHAREQVRGIAAPVLDGPAVRAQAANQSCHEDHDRQGVRHDNHTGAHGDASPRTGPGECLRSPGGRQRPASVNDACVPAARGHRSGAALGRSEAGPWCAADAAGNQRRDHGAAKGRGRTQWAARRCREVAAGRAAHAAGDERRGHKGGRGRARCRRRVSGAVDGRPSQVAGGQQPRRAGQAGDQRRPRGSVARDWDGTGLARGAWHPVAPGAGGPWGALMLRVPAGAAPPGGEQAPKLLAPGRQRGAAPHGPGVWQGRADELGWRWQLVEVPVRADDFVDRSHHQAVSYDL
jgi:hypothetical protein